MELCCAQGVRDAIQGIGQRAAKIVCWVHLVLVSIGPGQQLGLACTCTTALRKPSHSEW
jgi:hypothetical protein